MTQPIFQQVDPARLKTPPQVRTQFSAEADRELQAAIASVGILIPILVYPEVEQGATDFIVLDGERRLRAARALSMKLVPVVVSDAPKKPGDRTLRQLIANGSRADLSPIEEATAIRSLMSETGWNAADSAKALGRSAATVSKLLALLDLPASLQQDVASGAIAISAGHQLARISDPDRQRALAADVKSGRLNRDDIASASKRLVAAGRAGVPTAVPQNRLIARLDTVRSMTLSGIDATLDAIVAAAKDLLTSARAAQKQGIECTTYLRMLKDQAKV